MKKIILPLAVSLILGSCGRDDVGTDTIITAPVAEPTPVLEQVFVRKITSEEEEEEIYFRYNEAKNELLEIRYMEENVETGKRTFTYNNRGQIVSSEYVKGTEVINDNYHYNANGTLSQSVSVLRNNIGEQVITRNYDYSTAGKVVVQHKKEDRNFNTSEELPYTYITEGDKITKRIVEYTGVMTIESDYTYNADYKTPFANVKGLAALKLVEGFYTRDEGFGLIHNITRVGEKNIQAYGTIETNTNTHWTYNANKYPEKQVVETNIPRNGRVITTVRTYLYEY